MRLFNAGHQVHKARLADGRQVAVKVQYPGLRGAANADLTTLGCLSRCAEALFPEFRLGWLFDELQLKLTEELGEWCAAPFVRG
jgi:aarF domain-containing kinase